MTFDVLDQGCVHARLPARPTGLKELHDLSIEAHSHRLLVHSAPRTPAAALSLQFTEGPHPRELLRCKFRIVGIGLDTRLDAGLLGGRVKSEPAFICGLFALHRCEPPGWWTGAD